MFTKMGKSKKGFTLIELIAVIAILGILALIVVPRLAGFTDQAKIRSDKASAATIGKAVEAYYATNGAPASVVEFTYGGGSAATGSTSQAAIDAMVKNGSGNLPKPQYDTGANTAFYVAVDTGGACTVKYNTTSGAILFPEK